MAFRNLSLNDESSSWWVFTNCLREGAGGIVAKDAVPGTHFKFNLNDIAPGFLLLCVNVGTVMVGDGLYLPIEFSRD